MAVWGRDTPWRQGHVLPDQAVEAARLRTETETNVVAIVVSHDCDIAKDPHVEPTVEVIVGRRIGEADGNFTNSKNARRLHLTFDAGDEHLTGDFEAHRKVQVSKDCLASYSPNGTVKLTSNSRNILQRWLAARYRRSAFPDEFDRRLESTGIHGQLSKILKSTGSVIAAIYFDVDDGEEISRNSPDEPYTLNIYLLYTTTIDPEDAEQRTLDVARRIRGVFRGRCFSEEVGAWHDIELVACEAISDQAMTVWQHEHLKRWSTDHISLRAQPPETMLHDE